MSELPSSITIQFVTTPAELEASAKEARKAMRPRSFLPMVVVFVIGTIGLLNVIAYGLLSASRNQVYYQDLVKFNAFLVLAAGFFGLFLWWRKRKRKKKESEALGDNEHKEVKFKIRLSKEAFFWQAGKTAKQRKFPWETFKYYANGPLWIFALQDEYLISIKKEELTEEECATVVQLLRQHVPRNRQPRGLRKMR